MLAKLKTTIGSILPALLITYLGPLLAMALVYSISQQTDIPVAHFTRDAAAVAGRPPHTGVISNLGFILWGAAAAICFFASALLSPHKDQRGFEAYFLLAGLLSLLLLLDDMMMLHEKTFPERLDIPDETTYNVYKLLVLVYLVAFARTILKTDFVLLAIALGFFALSTWIDVNEHTLELKHHYLVEDGAKLFGIAGWLGYYARTAWQQVRRGQSSDEEKQ